MMAINPDDHAVPVYEPDKSHWKEPVGPHVGPAFALTELDFDHTDD
jgi:hypothetical protein